MTAILTVEEMEACGNKEIEITDKMVRVEGTSMGLMPGDVVNLDALAKGMLLASGNDAANAAAFAVGGDLENFRAIMNEKAKLIGMQSTKFLTPSGLEHGGKPYSTAKDMATLGSYAMENDIFADIASKKSLQVKFVSPVKTVNIKNHNKLLRIYDGCIGIKTGFTKAAGRCLVSCAQKNGVKLVCVTLNAPGDWDDHMALFNYGFVNTVIKNFDERNFSITIPVEDGELDYAQLYGATEFSSTFKTGEDVKVKRVLEIPEKCKAPLEKGQIIGKVVYYLDGKVIGKNDIVSNQNVKALKMHESFYKKISNFFKRLF